MSETAWRAKEIVAKEEVVLLDNTPPFYFHFQVKQRNGVWTDVWYEKTKTGVMEWNCNAVTKTKTGGSWGCVMYKGTRETPYCSHTLACDILLKNESFLKSSDHKMEEANQ